MPPRASKKALAQALCTTKDQPLDEPTNSDAGIITETSNEVIINGKRQSGEAKRKREIIKDVTDPGVEGTPKKAKRSIKVKAKEQEVVNDNDEPSEATSATTKKKTKTVKREAVDVDSEEVRAEVEEETATPKKKRKRKTKEEKEAEAMPIAARTIGLRMYIGAHVSGAKGWFQHPTRGCEMYIASIELNKFAILGVHNSITNCVHIG